MTSKWLERSRIWLLCGKIDEKTLILPNQLHFLTKYSWDVTQRECKSNENRCLNHVFSSGATDKLPGREKPHAKTVAWSFDVEGHARKCVE